MQGLDFQQQSFKELIDALVRCLVIDTTKATVLGYITAPVLGTTGAGWVYYGGEVFYFESQNAAIGGGQYLAAAISANPTDVAIQTELSDGSLVSIHDQRTITFTPTNGSSSDPFLNMANWVQLGQNCIYLTPPAINVVSAGDFGSGWSPNNRLMYYLLGNEITIQGDANWTGSGTLIFTLPAGYRPAYQLTFPIIEIQSGWTIGVIQIATNGQVTLVSNSVSSAQSINFTTKFSIL